MNRCMCGAMVLVVLGLSAREGRGDIQDEAASPPSDTTASDASNFHARAGFGVAPVAFRSTDPLPRAHHGVGAFFAAFGELPYRFSLGGGFDWERYSYETTIAGSSRLDAPVFPEETLTLTRLLGVAEWSVLERGLVNPYLLAVAGWGWAQATKTRWQCSPETISGPVLGGGAGVDVAAARWLAIGLEYRIATPPIAIPPMACSLVHDQAEPVGPPSFFPQRIALTLTVNDAF